MNRLRYWFRYTLKDRLQMLLCSFKISIHRCGHPGCWAPAKARPSMTQYHWNGKGRNPNADVILCDSCGEEYRSYWQEQWDEYWSGQR